jgi:putative ABC transport system permease protein
MLELGENIPKMDKHSENGFTMARMLWGNLKVRPMRTALNVAAVALQVFLLLFMVGLTTGIVSEWGKRVEGIGADILVQAPNSSIFFAFSPAVMLEEVGTRIAEVSGVDEVSPVLVLMNPQQMDVVYGIDFRSFNALSKGFLFRSGRPIEADSEALIDDIKAETKKLKIGDKLTLFGRDFNIVGIVAHGKGARSFISLKAAQEIAGAENRVSLFYVRSKGDTEATREAIVRLLPDHRVRSMSEYLTLMNSSNLPQFRPFIRSFVVVGVIISFLVVLLSMHTMVLERTREIGILKALGSSRLDILRLLLTEVMFMAGVGILLGMAGTYLVKSVVVRAVPTMTIIIPEPWILGAVLLAIGAAVLGALLPAFRACRFDPVDALAYE